MSSFIKIIFIYYFLLSLKIYLCIIISGDFAVLLNSGLSIKQALVMNFISSLMAYIGGIIGVSLGTQWAASPWVFAFTAGLFIYIALVDMVSTRAYCMADVCNRSWVGSFARVSWN